MKICIIIDKRNIWLTKKHTDQVRVLQSKMWNVLHWNETKVVVSLTGTMYVGSVTRGLKYRLMAWRLIWQQLWWETRPVVWLELCHSHYAMVAYGVAAYMTRMQISVKWNHNLLEPHHNQPAATYVAHKFTEIQNTSTSNIWKCLITGRHCYSGVWRLNKALLFI